VCYFGGERAERSVVIVVHKIILRSVVKRNVCNNIIITLSSWMTVGKDRILETEIEGTRSHSVENPLWKRLWTYRLRQATNDDDDDDDDDDDVGYYYYYYGGMLIKRFTNFEGVW
jgi:hypothetical protein